MNSIIEKAILIRNNVKTNSFNPSEFTSFKEDFPKFYSMLLNPNMDEEMFGKLVHMLESKSITTQDDAIEFSQFGAEKYVYPQFGKPSENDVKIAKEKISKRY